MLDLDINNMFKLRFEYRVEFLVFLEHLSEDCDEYCSFDLILTLPSKNFVFLTFFIIYFLKYRFLLLNYFIYYFIIL